MPTYAYACKECGHRFEAVQSFADPTLTACPECSGPLRKEYGTIGVTFNGPGFYRTDSRSGGKDSPSGDRESRSGAKGSDSASGDSTSSKSTSPPGGDSGASSSAPKTDSKTTTPSPAPAGR